jgi:ADP-heptose:LPS heptosyltransferase
MASLDLLITVDSMPAHLAGALGIPVWTLLRKEADWRWMDEGDDSPWYPTMRLFRQRAEGEWPDVIERVAESLRARGTSLVR